MNYDWNFARILPYWQAFLSGTATTLVLTILVVICGTVLGVATGLVLRRRFARLTLYPLIDFVRALPPLVLILFMYYLLTKQVIGTTVQAFWVYVIAMALNLAAFTADVVRAAIDNVPTGAIDAGRALGMSHKQVTRHIVLPHVLRETIPAMTVLYIGMLKMSSLASVINVREVVYTAQTVIADIARSLEAWVVVAVVYVVLVIPSTYAARWIETWTRTGSIASKVI
ncbi:MAG: amino acid ABC transporter permease [Verrucomicrobiae bacterium]|nr:amino acid ABC transporter permease [Verrucomicrobiae bacterium]